MHNHINRGRGLKRIRSFQLEKVLIYHGDVPGAGRFDYPGSYDYVLMFRRNHMLFLAVFDRGAADILTSSATELCLPQ